MPASEKVRVVVVTTAYRFEGDIYISPGANLMDELNRSREFIPLHNVMLFDPVDGHPMDKLEFVAVNKPQILMITPAKV